MCICRINHALMATLLKSIHIVEYYINKWLKMCLTFVTSIFNTSNNWKTEKVRPRNHDSATLRAGFHTDYNHPFGFYTYSSVIWADLTIIPVQLLLRNRLIVPEALDWVSKNCKSKLHLTAGHKDDKPTWDFQIKWSFNAGLIDCWKGCTVTWKSATVND